MRLNPLGYKCRVLILSLLPISAFALESLEDELLGGVTGQTGIDIKVAARVNIDNAYFETESDQANTGNRANFGNILIDTDSRGAGGIKGASNDAITLKLDAVNSGYRKGLVMLISDVESLDLTVQDLSVSRYNKITGLVSEKTAFGSIGFQKLNFNGGIAEMSVIGRAGDGNQGIEVGFSLPEGTTLDLTINDFEYGAGSTAGDAPVRGGELRASLELNGFSIESTIDIIDLGLGREGIAGEQGIEQGAAIKITYKSMEGDFDLTKFSAGTGLVYQGGYGQVQMDGFQLKRGYLIVDAI